jgi:hypothetical protein
MTKITKATIKKFIRDNKENLNINVKSKFDGMYDCAMPLDGGFRKVDETTKMLDNTMGIDGLWIVGSGGNYFTAHDDGLFAGIEIYNCCGTSVIAVRKEV